MLRIRILGPLEVENEQGLVQLGGARQRAVLAVLVLRVNEIVPKESLFTAVWGERPPATVDDALHNQIGQLRKLLGAAVIETRAPGYRLRVAPEQIDGGSSSSDLLQRARGVVPRKRCEDARPGAGAVAGRAARRSDLRDASRRRRSRAWCDLRLRSACRARLEAELECGRHAEVVSGTAACSPPTRFTRRLARTCSSSRSTAAGPAGRGDAGLHGRVRDLLDEELRATARARRCRQTYKLILQPFAALSRFPPGGATPTARRTLRARSFEQHWHRSWFRCSARALGGSAPAPDRRRRPSTSRSASAARPSTRRPRARRPVGRGHPRRRVRCTTSCTRCTRRNSARSRASIARRAAAAPPRSRPAVPAAADPRLRSHARAGVLGRGRGVRRRVVRRARTRPREVPAHRGGRLSEGDRRAESRGRAGRGERTLILKLNGGSDELMGRVRDTYVVSEDDYIDYLSQSDAWAVLPVGLAAASAGAISCSSATTSTSGVCACSCAGSGERSASLSLLGHRAQGSRIIEQVMAPTRRRRARRRPGRVARGAEAPTRRRSGRGGPV